MKVKIVGFAAFSLLLGVSVWGCQAISDSHNVSVRSSSKAAIEGGGMDRLSQVRGADIPNFSALGYVGEGVKMWGHNNTYAERYAVHGGRRVVVTEEAKSPVTNKWESVRHVDGASFDIVVAASGGQDHVAFAGVDRFGGLVVEAWQLEIEPSSGSGSTGAGQSSSSLGPKVFSKTLVYRGPYPSAIVAAGYDPLHRFVLLLVDNAGVKELYQYPTDAATPPQLLYDSLALPQLANMTMIAPYDHVSLGRIWVLDEGETQLSSVILFDSNNDGILEGPPLTGTRPQLIASGLGNYLDWDPLAGD